jgi:apoptosis-stimulating of p53 protein 1
MTTTDENERGNVDAENAAKGRRSKETADSQEESGTAVPPAPPPPRHEQQQQQTRYDQNLTGKYESQQQSGKHDPTGNQAKHEQHLHNIKYESSGQNSQQYGKHEQQQQHEGRLSTKYDHNPTFKHDSSNITQYKAESNKYESSQNKFEVPAKYEQNSTTKHVVDHVAVKFEMPVKTTDRPFEFDSRPTTKNSDNSERKTFNELRIEDKTKPALPPKPSKPNPPPRLTHHEKIDVPSSEGINECKMGNANLNSRFVTVTDFIQL